MAESGLKRDIHAAGWSLSTEQAIGLLEEKLALGYWIWDFRSGGMWWSRGFYGLLGFQPGTISPSAIDLERMIHTDDRVRLCDIERSLRDSIAVHREFRIVMQDGRVRWLKSQIDPVVTAGGVSSKAVGVSIDITKDRDTLHVLRRANDRFTALCKLEAALIWTASPYGSRIDVLNLREANAENADLLCQIHPDDRHKLSLRIAHSAAARKPFKIMLRFRSADGGYRLRNSRVAPICDGRGEVMEWVGISPDPQDSEAEFDSTTGSRTPTGSQLRGARGMLRWSVADLAQAAGVSVAAIRRLEEISGALRPEPAHEAIAKALVEAGIEFTFSIDGKPGVRPR
jgi:PAS domain-containing protein